MEALDKFRACRVCLATDMKLHNLYENKLSEDFVKLLGIKLSKSDGMLHHICVNCRAMLRNFYKFHQRCWIIQKLMEEALSNKKCLTAFIQNIGSDKYKLAILSQSNLNIIEFLETEQPTVKTEELSCIKLDNEGTHDFSTSYDDYVENLMDYEDFAEPNKTELNSEEAIDNTNLNIKEPCNALKIKEKKIDYKNEFSKQSKKTTRKKTIKPKKCNKNSIDKEDFYELDNSVTKENEYNVLIVKLTKEQQIEEVQSRKNSCNYIDSPLKCEICFNGFTAEKAFKNHMAKHDPSAGSRSCDICFARFSSRRTYYSHLSRHRLQFLCTLCKHVSKDWGQAKQHFKWHSGVKYECKYCGASFDKPSSHLSHVRISHPARHVSCDLCGETFIGARGVSCHKQKAHRDQVLPDGDEPATNKGTDKAMEYKCEECNKVFSSEASRSTHHQRVHMNVKWRYGKRPFNKYKCVVCDVCGKKYTTKTMLIYHLSAHTGVRPYQCERCPKSFAQPQILVYHMRTHTGERPYQCTICPKSFICKSNLDRHQLVHTGEKRYSCEVCGKQFSQHGGVKLHMRSVHMRIAS